MKIRVPRHLGASLDARQPDQLPQLGTTEGEASIPVISIEGTQLVSLLVEVATNAWKGQLRLAKWPGEELPAERRRLERNFESILSSLEGFGVRVKDHTGEAYDYGQALKVVASQPQDGIAREVVTETIRPTVYWREHIIQRGEVVIATPQEEG
jgi:hypothetical protein